MASTAQHGTAQRGPTAAEVGDLKVGVVAELALMGKSEAYRGEIPLFDPPLGVSLGEPRFLV